MFWPNVHFLVNQNPYNQNINVNAQNTQEFIQSFFDLLENKLKRYQLHFTIYSILYFVCNAGAFLISITISILSYLTQYGKLEIRSASIINGILGLIIIALHGLVTNLNLDSQRISALWKRDYLIKLKEKLSFQSLRLLDSQQLMALFSKHLSKLDRFSRRSITSALIEKNELKFVPMFDNRYYLAYSETLRLRNKFLDYLTKRKRNCTRSFYFFSVLYYPVVITIYFLSVSITVLSFLIASNVYPNQNETFGLVVGITSVFIGAGNQYLNWSKLDAKRQNFLLQREFCQLIWQKIYFLPIERYNLKSFNKLINRYYHKLSGITKYRLWI